MTRLHLWARLIFCCFPPPSRSGLQHTLTTSPQSRTHDDNNKNKRARKRSKKTVSPQGKMKVGSVFIDLPRFYLPFPPFFLPLPATYLFFSLSPLVPPKPCGPAGTSGNPIWLLGGCNGSNPLFGALAASVVAGERFQSVQVKL